MRIRIPFTKRRSSAPDLYLDVALVSDVGCVRTNNEDSGVIVNRSGSRKLEGEGMLVVVADGMGGHAAGEVASQMAVELIPRVYFEAGRPGAAALVQSIEASNRAIFERASSASECAGMGTTVVTLVLQDEKAWVAHVGDSRLYRLRGDEIEAVTQDHSLVRQLVERGILSEQEAEGHPDSNVILRALGTQPSVEVEAPANPMPLRVGDQFVLCSDGLTDLVSAREIQQQLGGAPAFEASQALVDLAKSRGGHDNVTVAVVRIHAHGDEPRQEVPETRGAKT